MHLEHLCCGCDLTMHLLVSPLLALGLVVAPARPKAMEENVPGISPPAGTIRGWESALLSARSARSQTGAVDSTVLQVPPMGTAASDGFDQIELAAGPLSQQH